MMTYLLRVYDPMDHIIKEIELPADRRTSTDFRGHTGWCAIGRIEIIPRTYASPVTEHEDEYPLNGGIQD